MKNILKDRGFGLHGQTKARLFGLLVSMGLAATLSSVAHAATPAAGTTIGNQASVTYTDSSSLQQVATSNLVQTTVAQVGSLALTNGNSKTVAAGQTAYMPHTLSNTGNGTDSFTIQATGTAFTKVEIFADADGDGLPDNTTPLCSSSGAPLCTTGFSTSVAGGGTFKYVVALTVSGSAPSGLITPSATTTATAGTPALYLTSTASNTDAVTVTSSAAFQVNKSVAAPAAATGITPPAGVASWPAAVSSSLPSGSACAATLAGANAPAAGCVYTTYTLRYQNNGGSSGNIYFKDVIGAGSTSGLTYVPGSAKWSSGNAALTDAAGSETASGIDFQAVSGTIEAVVSSVGPNVSGSISFIVMVNSSAALGTGTTTNVAAYSDTGCASTTVAACSASSTVSTNGSGITILQSFGVVANTVTSSASTAAVDKIKKITSAAPGTQVSFANVIWNTGSGTDTFNLSTSALTINGIAVIPTLYAADGATPLTDSNGDGVIDTGPVAVGTSKSIVVKYTVPSAACTPTCPAGPFDLVVTAKSAGDTTKSDTVTDEIQAGALTAASVDLKNTTGEGVGAGVAGASYTNVVAGTTQQIPLTVNNTSGASENYGLSYTATLPAGWSISFTLGACGSGGATTSSVGPIAAAGSADVCANVVTAAGSAPVATTITFMAASAGTGASDTMANTITIKTNAAITVAPGQSGQIAAGGTVVFPFTVLNVGNVSCGGSFTVTATLDSAANTAGWTATVFVDNNGDGQIDAGDTALTSSNWAFTLASGSPAKLLVRVFAPGGATAGATGSVTLQVADAGANSCTAGSAVGVATVISGQLRVQKTQALNTTCGAAPGAPSAAAIPSAKPTQCIYYKVDVTNQGTAQVSNVTINDAIPANTTYFAGSNDTCSAGGTLTQSAGTVSCGAFANLLPGATVTLTFEVQINP